MEKIKRQKELPEWFLISIPDASFNSRDLQELFCCKSTTIWKLMKNKPTCNSNYCTNGERSSTNLWGKQVVLEVWNSLGVE
jgi:hypothetical protein